MNQTRSFTICIGEAATCTDCALKMNQPLSEREKGAMIHFTDLAQTESFLNRNPHLLDKIQSVFLAKTKMLQASGLLHKVFKKQQRPVVYYCD